MPFDITKARALLAKALDAGASEAESASCIGMLKRMGAKEDLSGSGIVEAMLGKPAGPSFDDIFRQAQARAQEQARDRAREEEARMAEWARQQRERHAQQQQARERASRRAAEEAERQAHARADEEFRREREEKIPNPGVTGTWQQKCKWLRQLPGHLKTEWERGFLDSISKRSRLTTRQEECLNKIYRKSMGQKEDAA